MINQQNLITALNIKIKETIGTDVSNRIYENLAPQDANLPCCVFSVVTDTLEPWFITDTLDADVQIDFYGYKRAGSKVLRFISDKLLNELHRFNLDIDGYDYSFIDYGKGSRGILTVEDENNRIRQQFNIVASEPVNIS